MDINDFLLVRKREKEPPFLPFFKTKEIQYIVMAHGGLTIQNMGTYLLGSKTF